MWWRDGPAPSGPMYNEAKHLIGRLDILVEANIENLTIKAGQSVSEFQTGFLPNLGASFPVTFTFMILLEGTLQWFSIRQTRASLPPAKDACSAC